MHLLVLLSCFLVFAQSLVVGPELIEDDPFYKQPRNISSYRLGQIIRTRAAPSAVRTFYIDMAVNNVWQFALRSEDSFGRPQAVFTTVIEPFNADNEKLLSFQFAQDSPSVDCSPSYTILSGARIDPLYTEMESVGMEWALKEGWYVNIPDHEGPKAAFGVGPQAGKALLNSLRAVLSSGKKTGIDPDAQVIMWGYSGGTIPTGWASSMLSSYAAELKPNIKGAVLGGWVTNITATAEAVDGTLYAGLIPNAVNGILNEYSYLYPYIYDFLEKEAAKEFKRAKRLCLIPSIAYYFKAHFFTGEDPWFEDGFEVLEQEEVQEVINEVSLGLNENVEPPEIPFYIFHSVSDDVVPYKPARRLYERFCRQGAPSIEFHEMKRPDHLFAFIEGVLPSMKWVQKRFDGEEPIKRCSRVQRSRISEIKGAAIPYKKYLKTVWSLVTGRKIGPHDYDEGSIKAGIRKTIKHKIVEKAKKFGLLSTIEEALL